MEIKLYQQADQMQVLSMLQKNIPRYFAVEEYDDFVHYLHHEVEDYFVVQQDHRLIAAGGINYFLDEGLAKISWDIVDPDFQNKGVGTRLLAFRLAHIRSHPEINKIMVRTSQLANEFYGKNGFLEIDRQENYWAAGFDLVIMEYQGN